MVLDEVDREVVAPTDDRPVDAPVVEVEMLEEELADGLALNADPVVVGFGADVEVVLSDELVATDVAVDGLALVTLDVVVDGLELAEVDVEVAGPKLTAVDVEIDGPEPAADDVVVDGPTFAAVDGLAVADGDVVADKVLPVLELDGLAALVVVVADGPVLVVIDVDDNGLEAGLADELEVVALDVVVDGLELVEGAAVAEELELAGVDVVVEEVEPATVDVDDDGLELVVVDEPELVVLDVVVDGLLAVLEVADGLAALEVVVDRVELVESDAVVGLELVDVDPVLDDPEPVDVDPPPDEPLDGVEALAVRSAAVELDDAAAEAAEATPAPRMASIIPAQRIRSAKRRLLAAGPPGGGPRRAFGAGLSGMGAQSGLTDGGVPHEDNKWTRVLDGRSIKPGPGYPRGGKRYTPLSDDKRSNIQCIAASGFPQCPNPALELVKDHLRAAAELILRATRSAPTKTEKVRSPPRRRRPAGHGRRMVGTGSV